ncbi:MULTISPECIES: MarR family transcriptional regulator [unclassified Pseudomonas]|uniref:MarR family winged helix-turn-helix transcriptional regulator n=1 Tax=unclassified Pseudomonas TaxID=196821 RepID=UPI0007310FFF|nr:MULTISPECIES: MarR family transcriptional regulator [unclassified Pseudomonas]KSW27088.1 MarR family transcriptional regulator [Pseudomonas sp. ADP]OBP09782.1 MarR family transcriptional regulator [Pseudomonas sp. EGD-AKN5]QOF83745.1 MarR family transcriptional regulator [Pseudomonas sp. ADPe]
MDRATFAAEQWRQQLPGLDTAGMVVLGRLAEAAQLIARDHLNPLFARFGLQPGEFDVLATLRRSGPPYRLTPTTLYEAAMISSGSMTNRLDRLEKAGLVQRLPNPEDGRGTLVGLSEAGLTLIDGAVNAHVANQRRVLAGLDAAEQVQLAGLLEKLLATLPDDDH